MGTLSRRSLLAALLCAGRSRGAGDRSPFPSPQDFTLSESLAEIEKRLGPPHHTAHGRGFKLWQYIREREDRPHDDDRFDLSFYFEMPSGQLLGVSRDFDTAVSIADLHPAAQWKRHAYPNEERPELLVYTHRLEQRVILAVGVDEEKLTTHQIIVMRESALPRFYGWIRL